jgi:hypothetical protein
MRLVRFVVFLGVFAILNLGLVGCGNSSRPQPQPEASPPPTAAAPQPLAANVIQAAATADAPPLVPVSAAAEPSAQEKYDAALLDALNSLAEHKYPEALTSLLAAKTVQNTEEIRRQVDRVRGLIEQQMAAEQTAKDIHTVLKDGKPEEASQLATAGLQQFGATDNAPQLVQLKQQADVIGGLNAADAATCRSRYNREGEAALKENNLRAAVLAWDQALHYGEDADLRRQVEELRGRLQRYDEQRARALELRRDPAHIEDAIAALNDAAHAWDTLQVRQDIDDYNLALQKRRERFSVAEFEVRGEIGIPFAGRTEAEELLPAFKPRFDLVERAQVA